MASNYLYQVCKSLYCGLILLCAEKSLNLTSLCRTYLFLWHICLCCPRNVNFWIWTIILIKMNNVLEIDNFILLLLFPSFSERNTDNFSLCVMKIPTKSSRVFSCMKMLYMIYVFKCLSWNILQRRVYWKMF